MFSVKLWLEFFLLNEETQLWLNAKFLNDFMQSHKKMINFWALQVHAVVSILHWESSLKTNMNTCLENTWCTYSLVENTVCVHYISSILELQLHLPSAGDFDCCMIVLSSVMQWFMWMGECRECFLHCSVFRRHLPITGVSSCGLGESMGSSTCQHMWGPGFNPQGCV